MVFRAEVTMVDTRAGEGIGRGATTQDPYGPRTSLGKRGRADGAPLAGAVVAIGAGPGPGEVHEEAELIFDVELRVCSDAKSHLMTLASLVLFAHEAVERGTSQVLAEARVVVTVRVVDEVAGQAGRALGGAHATDHDDGEGHSCVLVAECEEVRRVRAKESNNNVPADALLVSMRSAEDASHALGEAGIGHVSLDQ
jgi:hypothetical protein